MNCEKLSPRQLWVAVLTGGLSAGAAAAGRADWRWLLLSAALGAAVGWLLLRRVGWSPLHPALRILYAGWAAVLMADVLSRTAGRIQQAAGKEGPMGWLLVLLALPLAWMGWGKAAAFFRAAEIFWLALLATAGAVFLLGLPRMDWGWAMVPGGGWKESLAAGGLTMSTGLFVLPHLYTVEAGQRQDSRGLVWLGALGAASAGLALLTAGLLHPHTSARLDAPFFTAAGRADLRPVAAIRPDPGRPAGPVLGGGASAHPGGSGRAGAGPHRGIRAPAPGTALPGLPGAGPADGRPPAGSE